MAWGAGFCGQQENVPEGNDFTEISGRKEHCLALRSDGSIVAWGSDEYGQVSDTPSGTGFAAISTGAAHSLALREDGSIVAWGSDEYGQVSETPLGTGFVAISAGGWHSLALTVDGTIVHWGRDEHHLANYPTDPGFDAIYAGHDFSMAIKNKKLVAWGLDWYGLMNIPSPNPEYSAASGGHYHSLGLRPDGSIQAWGEDTNGKLTVPVGDSFTTVSAGWEHSLALRPDGSIVAWGLDELSEETPTSGTFTAIAAGRFHSLALESVPAPSTLVGLISMGLMGALGYWRRRRRAA